MNLRRALLECEEVKLVLNWEKYHFILNKSIVFHYKITQKGLEVDMEKIEVIEKFPLSSNLNESKVFLVMEDYTNDLSRAFPRIHTLCANCWKKVKFTFHKTFLQAFKCLKEKSISTSANIALDYSKPFEVMCDSSGIYWGVVLQKKVQKDLAPHLLCE